MSTQQPNNIDPEALLELRDQGLSVADAVAIANELANPHEVLAMAQREAEADQQC